MKQYDFLIVGAGLTGMVLARELTDAGKSCLVVDQRDHIGGNTHDKIIEGVNVHQYGGHIFHTNNDTIWKYINNFTSFLQYEHRVKAFFEGKYYSFPPNLLTYQQIGIDPDDSALEQVLMEMFFRGYSEKQWGRPLEDVPKSAIGRIPLRKSFDDRYFGARYQGLPTNGYSAVNDKLMAGIDRELSTDYNANRQELRSKAKQLIYTGPLDALYDFVHGPLEFRSLRFHTEVHDDKMVHPMSTTNYTGAEDSRIRTVNWSHFGWVQGRTNIMTHEWSIPHVHGETEAHYPINDPMNSAVQKVYEEQARKDDVIFAGRLGRYQYINMDMAIGNALSIARGILVNG